MPWFEGDMKITCVQFIFQLYYEIDIKLWLMKLFLQK